MKGVAPPELVDRILMLVIGLIAVAVALYFTGGKKSSIDISFLISIATAFAFLLSMEKNNWSGFSGFDK